MPRETLLVELQPSQIDTQQLEAALAALPRVPAQSYIDVFQGHDNSGEVQVSAAPTEPIQTAVTPEPPPTQPTTQPRIMPTRFTA